MKLNIKNMVISFRCAVYLKQKGVKQESLFYWVATENGVELKSHIDINALLSGRKMLPKQMPENSYSAFLTDELRAILEENKPFELNAIHYRFKYKDATIGQSFTDFYSIGTVLIRTLMRYENQIKNLRNIEPKTPPKSPNPNPHENIL